MPEQDVRDTYAILVGGGLVVLGLVGLANPPPQRHFVMAGRFCDPQGVMAWLRRKLNQGKITADDIQRLLNTSIRFQDWLQAMMLKHSAFTIGDVGELLAVCPGTSAMHTTSLHTPSSFPCLPFCQ